MDADPSVETLVLLIDDLVAQHGDIVTVQSTALTDTGDDVRIDVAVRVGATVQSRWAIECVDVLEHRFTLGAHDGVEVQTDHVLLLDHVDRRAQLFFTGPVPDVAATLGSLAVAHDAMAGDWRVVGRYLNQLMPIEDLLAKPSGKLAEGPATLLAAYVEALDHVGVTTSLLDAGPAKRWDTERQWVEIGDDVMALVLPGWLPTSLPGCRNDSYAVAQGFAATQLS